MTFAPMATYLAPDYPCYGLTVPGFNGEQAPLERVEEIAAAMLGICAACSPQGRTNWPATRMADWWRLKQRSNSPQQARLSRCWRC